MTTRNSARTVAHGAVLLLIVQASIGVGQFVYAGITARIFLPAEFGTFAAALSLYSIFSLVGATGPASFILRERVVGSGTRRKLLCMNILASSSTAILFWALLPSWSDLLNAPKGVEFTPVLCFSLLITPFAAAQSAFLRREGRTAIDGVVLFAAFFLASALGLVLVLGTRELWTLAVATCANQLVVLIASRVLRKVDIRPAEGVPWSLIFRYTTNVTIQNSIFMLIQQAPSWFVGAVSGPAALGHYSRATTLAYLPAISMATALNRVLQPLYRTFDSASSRSKAVADSTLVAAALSFPLFGTLAAIGPAVVEVWLGPGWELAGQLVWLLAVAFALQVPYTILAGNLELQGRFNPGRWSQVGMVLALCLAMGIFAVSQDLMWAAAAVLASHLAGLVALCLLAPDDGSGSKARLHLGLTAQAVLASLLYGFVRLTMHFLEQWAWFDGALSAVVQIGAACLAALIFMALTAWCNPILEILRRRGLTPAPRAPAQSRKSRRQT